MKRMIRASNTFPSSITFAKQLVDAIKEETDSEVTHNIRYNEICIHDIVNLRTVTSFVVDALKNLGYDVYVPEFEDYIAVIKDDTYIRIFVSDYLEADNEYNGYVDIDFKEYNLNLADWR